jgi:hypothetical protein
MSANGRTDEAIEELIAVELGAGATYAEAGAAARVSARTVRRRMEDPEFRAEVNSLRRERVQAVRGRLATVASDGVSVLAELAAHASSESVRLGAARALVQMSLERPRGDLDLTGCSLEDVAHRAGRFGSRRNSTSSCVPSSFARAYEKPSGCATRDRDVCRAAARKARRSPVN